MIKKLIKKYKSKIEKRLVEERDDKKMIFGKQLCFSQKNINANKLSDIEFRVFSQWGEDGIIEYIVNNIPIKNKTFIEFGVENYNESNTRFLMMNRNWSGLIIDGSEQNINYVKKRSYFWKYDLTATASFITKENINTLITAKLEKMKINKDVGLLSVDIDGVDYWVLKEIICIDPVIIICEYNSTFGNKIPLTVPYDKEFERSNYHYSNLYWGANLKAFDNLLTKKGYIYIGSNLECTNAFFVKNDMCKKYLPEFFESEIAFDKSKIRESKDIKGNLSYLRGNERLDVIKELELINIDTENKIKISELSDM